MAGRPIDEAPSRGAIAYSLVVGLAALGVTGWLGWGAQTSREVAGAFFAAGFTLAMLLEAWSNWVKRSEVAARAQRRAVLERAARADHDPTMTEPWEQGRYKPGPY